MPDLPKSLITLGANLLTARTAWHLRSRARGTTAQHRTFKRLLAQLQGAAVWRQAGITAGMDYEAFRQRIPISTYATLESAIERMQAGEPDVLWPGTCPAYAASAGTVGPKRKLVPLTDQMLDHFAGACRKVGLFYLARVGHCGSLKGDPLFVAGSTTVRPLPAPAAPGACVVEWPGAVRQSLPEWLEARVQPEGSVAQMDDWNAKVEATIVRTIGADVSLLFGAPSWVLQFSEAMKARLAERNHRIGNLAEIWPNLECYVHGGCGIAPYAAELRSLLGADVAFHEYFGAVEAAVAVQDSHAPGSLRLLVDEGVFFEFLPLTEYDESRPDLARLKALRLDDVTVGVDYVVLLTTPGGLVRYVLGDVVRFSSVAPPRLSFAGRADAMLNGFDERLLERELNDVLLAVCQRHRWSIVNFHVAPLFAAGLTGQARGRHEWWVELRPGTVETPTGPQMAVELDSELQRVSSAYASRRHAGRIEAPVVRLVMPGVFRHWMRQRGRWAGDAKVVRCRSDRLLASELAGMTRFAED